MCENDDLRTALTKLAVPMYYDATPGAYPVTAVPMSHLLSLLAAHPAPETDDEPMDVFQLKAQRARTPASVSDTRREDVARALFEQDVRLDDTARLRGATRG